MASGKMISVRFSADDLELLNSIQQVKFGAEVKVTIPLAALIRELTMQTAALVKLDREIKGQL